MLERESIRVRSIITREGEEECRHYVNEIVSVCEIN